MSEQQQGRSEDSLRHEYTEAVQNVRHYSNLRFAVFSIFFAVIGGVGFVALGEGQFTDRAVSAARIAGFPVIVIFWLYEEGLDVQVRHATRIAVELDRALGYTLYTTRPTRHLNQWRYQWQILFRVFFSLLTLLWLYAVIAVPLT